MNYLLILVTCLSIGKLLGMDDVKVNRLDFYLRDLQNLIRDYLLKGDLHFTKTNMAPFVGLLGERHRDAITSVIITANNQWALTRSAKDLLIWNLQDKKKICSYPLLAHRKPITAAALSPNGRTALTASRDAVRLWALHQKFGTWTIIARSSFVNSVSLTDDGKWGLTQEFEGKALFWNFQDLKNIRSYELPGYSGSNLSITLSPDGRWASGSSANAGMIWDLQAPQSISLYLLQGHTDSITSLVLTPNGQWALTASLDNTVKLWDLTDPRVCFYELPLSAAYVELQALSSDGTRAVTVSADNTVIFWDLTDPNNIEQYLLQGRGYAKITSLVSTPDGLWYLTGSTDGRIVLWNLEDLTNINHYEMFLLSNDLMRDDSKVNTLSITPDGNWAFIGFYDGSVRLWHLSPASDSSLRDISWMILCKQNPHLIGGIKENYVGKSCYE